MVYGCGNSCVKFMVFTFNMLICLSGAVIMGVSLWANLDDNFGGHLADFSHATHQDFNNIGKYQGSLWVLVGVGGLLFLVGFLGCCGAACESTVLLTLFFIIVLILAVVELATAIFAIVNKGQFKTDLERVFYEGTATPDGVKQMKPIQDAFKCCGVKGRDQSLFDCTPEQQATGDCVDAVWNAVETAGTVAVVIAFLVLIIEALAMLFSCILCRAFRERSPGYYV